MPNFCGSDNPRDNIRQLLGKHLRKLGLVDDWKACLARNYEKFDDRTKAYDSAYLEIRHYIVSRRMPIVSENGWKMPDKMPMPKPFGPKASEKPVENDKQMIYNVPANAFDNRPHVTAKQEIEWVAEHLTVIRPSHHNCPSAKAWGLLQFAKDNDKNRAVFWSNHYAKLIPSKSEEEAKKAKKQDTKRMLARIDDALSKFEKADEEEILN